MPITRRRRVNPPEQTENPATNLAEQQAETEPKEQGAEPVVEQKSPRSQAKSQKSAEVEKQSHTEQTVTQPAPVPPATEPFPPAYQPFVAANSPAPSTVNPERVENGAEQMSGERLSRLPRNSHNEYSPTIEGGRRTSRGELFRRPPQQPVVPPVQQPAPTPTLQPPSHEISLPLGNLLHLAYNPGYTGSDEARSALLQKLANESKAGGRARCWSCGSLAIVYDNWNTRSKTFGEVGVAFCEICGVWSVM